MSESKARVRFIEQAIVAQEEERARIARELHDGIGQSLTSLLVGLRSLESVLEDDPEARELAAQLRETAGHAIDEVRSLAQGLRPAVLDDLGLAAAIDRLVEELAVRHQLAVDVQVAGLDAEPRLSPSVEITIYRIVQEALHNVAKHAKATRACVILDRRTDLVRLIVEDDGRGMDDGEVGDGFGLQGIRERLALINGELTIESTLGEGTTVFATIPCPAFAPRRFFLRHAGQEVPLGRGEYVIGRSSECDLRLDRRRVSRRHAKIQVGEHEAWLEDLGSMNGVFVNGRRVEGSIRLNDGDGIVIGDEEIEIGSALRQVGGEGGRAWGMERTLPGSVREGSKTMARDVTERANMLEVAGSMALRWLQEGRIADAERVLSGHLRQVLAAAKAGEAVKPSVVETSVAYALRLAGATRNVGWSRYALELLDRCRYPATSSTVGAIEALSREGLVLPGDLLGAYVRTLEGLAVDPGVVARMRKLT